MTTGRRKLLLADDSVTIQKVVSLTFADEGFDVVTVGDGEGALRELEEKVAPDIVLADVFMPKLGGYEVCARIKADARFRHIPVMLLVGTFEPFDEAEARRIGADDVLTKPFQSIRNLVNKVGGLLGGQSDQEQDTRDVSPPAGAESRSGASLSNRNQVDASDIGRGQDDSSAPSAGHPPPFADLVSDDATIKATPVAELGADYHPTSGAASSAPDVGETINYFGQSVAPAPGRYEPPSVNQEMIGAQTGGESRGQMSPKAWDTGTEETLVGQPGLTTRMANATAASDALLDLGDIEPPAATAEADDFILDLDDDVPAYSRSTGAPVEAATHGSAGKVGVEAGEGASQGTASSGRQSADYAGAFAEAAHGGAIDQSITPQFSGTAYAGEARHEQPVNYIEEKKTQDSFSHGTLQSFVAPVEAEEATAPHVSADYEEHLSPEEATAGEGATTNTRAMPGTSVSEGFYNTTPFSNVGEPSAAVAGRMSAEGEMRADQLSPEVIDRIARRAVEHLSERVVREIAWEVVPDLAERLIRQRLDEERQK